MDNSIAYMELLGVTLAGVRKPDQGLYWTDITGWTGLPDLRGETDSIPGGHGSFRRNTFHRESRVMTLTGHILAADPNELVQVRDRLESVLAQSYGPLSVVTTTTGKWTRDVEIKNLVIEPDHGKRYVKFVVDMVAPDPLRYKDVQRVGPASAPTYSGGVRFPQSTPFNFGTVNQGSSLFIGNTGGSVDAYPKLEIEGGFSYITVRNRTTGQVFIIDWPVAEGETLTIDNELRRIYAERTEITAQAATRQWFEIPPGETHEITFDVINPQGVPRMWAEFQIGAW